MSTRSPDWNLRCYCRPSGTEDDFVRLLTEVLHPIYLRVLILQFIPRQLTICISPTNTLRVRREMPCHFSLLSSDLKTFDPCPNGKSDLVQHLYGYFQSDITRQVFLLWRSIWLLFDSPRPRRNVPRSQIPESSLIDVLSFLPIRGVRFIGFGGDLGEDVGVWKRGLSGLSGSSSSVEGISIGAGVHDFETRVIDLSEEEVGVLFGLWDRKEKSNVSIDVVEDGNDASSGGDFGEEVDEETRRRRTRELRRRASPDSLWDLVALEKLPVPRLRKIRFYARCRVENEAVMAVFRNAEHLDFRDVGPDFILRLLKTPPKVTEMPFVHDIGSPHLPTTPLPEYKVPVKIRKLRLHRLDPGLLLEPALDSDILRGIQWLNIRGSRELTDAVLVSILGRLENLKSLTTARCRKLTWRSLAHIVAETRIEVLNFSMNNVQMHSEYVFQPAHFENRTMRILDVEYCGLSAYVFRLLKRCVNLEELWVGDMSNLQLEIIVNQIPSLKTLNMKMSQPGAAMPVLKNHPSLVDLSVFAHEWDAGFVADLPRGLKYLTFMMGRGIARESEAADETLIAAFENGPRLWSVSMDNVPVTVEFPKELLRRCPWIQELLVRNGFDHVF